MEYVNNINITGGEVVAIGGKLGGAGIGKSFAEENTVGKLVISNDAVVKAYAVSEIYDKFEDRKNNQDMWSNFYLKDLQNTVLTIVMNINLAIKMSLHLYMVMNLKVVMQLVWKLMKS